MAELKGAEIDIFEQQASFGGVWNYSSDASGTIDVPQTNPNQPLEEPNWQSDMNGFCNGEVEGVAYPTFSSPMYDRLETNIPHFLMKFSDAPSLENNQLFPTREAVTKYLKDYGESVKHLVRFRTQVTEVQQKHVSGQHGWSVQVKNLLHPNEVSEGEYDAVVVANGHYTVPSLPDIKGIREWHKVNKGVISHSKTYRRPEPFTNKKVVIVGNSASGVDIASQIAIVAKRPLLNSTRSDSAFTSEACYSETVSEIVEFLPQSYGSRAIRFSDGRIERDIDAILFCTGYYYSFLFLSSLLPKLISTGDRVQGLYKHIWYIPDPTLVFVGIPYKIIPFRTVQGQAAAIARVWAHRLDLPSEIEMCRWEESRIAECGTGKKFHTFQVPEDFKYHNEMMQWASCAQENANGVLPPIWTEKDTWTRTRFAAIKKAFADKGEERCKVRTVEELGFDYDSWLRDLEGKVLSK